MHETYPDDAPRRMTGREIGHQFVRGFARTFGATGAPLADDPERPPMSGDEFRAHHQEYRSARHAIEAEEAQSAIPTNTSDIQKIEEE